MKHLALSIRHTLRRAGWPGMLGLALLLGGPAFYVTEVTTMQEQAEALKSSQQQLRREIHHQQNQQTPVAPSIETQLTAFYRNFPAMDQSDAWLAKIYAAAEQQHIVLESGAYRMSPAEGGKLQRYQITLPLKGSHVQIRHFIAAMLKEAPALALDEISFKRENIDTPTINAVIKLTLFVGKQA